MSTKTSTDLIESAGGARSEPGGRAQRPAGGEPLELPEAIRDRLADEVIDELLAGATVLACFGRFRGLSLAAGCHWLHPLGSINAPSSGRESLMRRRIRRTPVSRDTALTTSV